MTEFVIVIQSIKLAVKIKLKEKLLIVFVNDYKSFQRTSVTFIINVNTVL